MLHTYLLYQKKENCVVNNMLIVGSSILILGKAFGVSIFVIVSPISKSSNPTIAQISPDKIVSIGFFPNP